MGEFKFSLLRLSDIYVILSRILIFLMLDFHFPMHACKRDLLEVYFNVKMCVGFSIEEVPSSGKEDIDCL